MLAGSAGAHDGPYRPAPKGWELVQRSVRSHGWLTRWNPIRDLEFHVTRVHRDGAGRETARQEEVQWVLKGARPKVRIERAVPGGDLVLALDGRRAWLTLNGTRLQSERGIAEAEEATRWAAFAARLPFVLGERDARSLYAGTDRFMDRPSLKVDVRYTGMSRPSEEDVVAHLDATTYRLLGLVRRSHRTPGARYVVELDRYSTFRGVFVPMRRTYRRLDAEETITEEITGLRLNQAPPGYLFSPP